MRDRRAAKGRPVERAGPGPGAPRRRPVERAGPGPGAPLAVIIAGYPAFVAALLISVTQAGVRPAVAVFPAAAVMAADALLLMWPARWRPPGRTAGARHCRTQPEPSP